MRKIKSLLWILVLIVLGSCTAVPEQEPTPPELEQLPAKVLISEIYTGEEGNNQADFIELHNAGSEIANLEGYSLWYQLKEGGDEILLTSWDESTLIPPFGSYALVQEGQQFQVLPDRVFNQPLVPSRGGLSLRHNGQVADQLSWGSGPVSMAEGSPAAELDVGEALARRIDPEAGHLQDTDDNQADFSLTSLPGLENTGSPINHPAAGLGFELEPPGLVKPGQDFELAFQVSNHTWIDLQDLRFELSLP